MSALDLYKNGDKSTGNRVISEIVNEINTAITTDRIIPKEVAAKGFAIESMSRDDINMLKDTANNLESKINDIVNVAFRGKDYKFKRHQVAAGIVAGIMSSESISNQFRNTREIKVNPDAYMPILNDGAYRRSDIMMNALASEAYSEQENRNIVAYNVMYNMGAATQNEFAEGFFPTIVLSPDNIGYTITTRVYTVYDEFLRNVDGSFADFKKKNIIRAFVDPTILKNNVTKVYPVYRTASSAKFVSNSLVAPRSIVLDTGETIQTAPLAITNKPIDILVLSHTDNMLANGNPDMTDTLDPAISIENIYIRFDVTGQNAATDVLKFKVFGLPTFNFIAAPQGSTSQGTYKLMNLNAVSDSIIIDYTKTKRADGSSLTALAGLVTGSYNVRLNVNLSGNVNVETGNLDVIGARVTINAIRNSTGELVPLDATELSTIVPILETGSLFGFDINAYKSNVNRRQRGQLIDPTMFTQQYNVPYRGPITTIHPITDTESGTDTSDLDIAITTTHIRASNDAVQTLVDMEATLNEYTNVLDANNNPPELFGIGRYFVKPSHYRVSIDMAEIVNNITSTDISADVSAALVNQIKYYARKMYIESEYGPASKVLFGESAGLPTVLVGTDPRIAQYIMTPGDLRTVGPDFNLRLVTSFNEQVSNQIFITFIVEDEDRNVRPCPLNFGNYIYAPELTAIMPISRNNTISKELAVQPRFLHVVNMPILARITVTNMEAILTKIALYQHPIP